MKQRNLNPKKLKQNKIKQSSRHKNLLHFLKKKLRKTECSRENLRRRQIYSLNLTRIKWSNQCQHKLVQMTKFAWMQTHLIHWRSLGKDLLIVVTKLNLNFAKYLSVDSRTTSPSIPSGATSRISVNLMTAWYYKINELISLEGSDSSRLLISEVSTWYWSLRTSMWFKESGSM